MSNPHTGAPSRGARYLNAILTVNAVLLGLLLVGQARPGAIPEMGGSAVAAPPPEDSDLNGRVSAAEQRKEMINELRSVNQHLMALDGKLKGPFQVKVLEMPRDGNKQAPAAAPAPGK